MRSWALGRDRSGTLRHAEVPIARLGDRNHPVKRIDIDALCNRIGKDLLRCDERRRRVLFFIHGHQLVLPGLRLDLLKQLHGRYAGPDGSVGTIIFFAWPDRGLPWSEDNEAHVAGRALFADHGQLLTRLSQACDGKLYLLVQSFGAHLLNGMVAAAIDACHRTPIFRATILVGTDAPRAAVRLGGVAVHSRGDRCRRYRLDALDRLSQRTVVLYDPADVVLLVSRALMMNRYPRLGRLGCAGLQVPEHITCRDVNGAGDLPRWPLTRHRSFIKSAGVVKAIAGQIRC